MRADTHWFVKDGAATFNWRFVFNIELPYCYKPKFFIAAYDRDPLSFSSELVGDWSKLDVKKV